MPIFHAIKNSISIFFYGVLTIPTAIAQVDDIYISGQINVKNSESGYILSNEAFNKLPKVTIRITTPWTSQNSIKKFEGVMLRDILALVNAKGNVLKMHALDGYWVDIPISDVEEFDLIIANSMDDTPLSLRNFGPYFVIYSSSRNNINIKSPIYLSRSIRQVNKIMVK